MKLKLTFREIELLLNVTILLSFSNFPEKMLHQLNYPKTGTFNQLQ